MFGDSMCVYIYIYIMCVCIYIYIYYVYIIYIYIYISSYNQFYPQSWCVGCTAVFSTRRFWKTCPWRSCQRTAWMSHEGSQIWQGCDMMLMMLDRLVEKKWRKTGLFYREVLFDILILFGRGAVNRPLKQLEWCWYSLLLNFPFSLAWNQELVWLLLSVAPMHAQYTRWSSKTILSDIGPWYPWKLLVPSMKYE